MFALLTNNTGITLGSFLFVRNHQNMESDIRLVLVVNYMRLVLVNDPSFSALISIFLSHCVGYDWLFLWRLLEVKPINSWILLLVGAKFIRNPSGDFNSFIFCDCLGSIWTFVTKLTHWRVTIAMTDKFTRQQD